MRIESTDDPISLSETQSLTPAILRTFPGLELVSDEEAIVLIDSLRVLARLLAEAEEKQSNHLPHKRFERNRRHGK